MDTRAKLLTLTQAAELPSLGLCVTGYFDPLLREHAEALHRFAAAEPVTVLLVEPPQPLLPLAARAELLAALRSVRHVIPLAGVSVEEALKQLPRATALAREEASDLLRRDAFLDYVRARHQNVVPR